VRGATRPGDAATVLTSRRSDKHRGPVQTRVSCMMEELSRTTIGEPKLATSYVMKVSANGQVSIPAEARSRWHADRVVVVDLGDRVVVRPLPADPIGALEGRYGGKGPSTTRARRQARAEDAALARRKQR
jgi:bifunctional DNA-binding transcriptional regulator/antitoxin component of YhaV-PrlF toxin-antitoxin module